MKRNKLFIVFAVAMWQYTTLFGQITETADKNLVRGSEDLKSGNYKDVLTSFFQLAAGDIIGPEKSFEFKSSLFGIKVRADSTLLIDTNYVYETFARNLEFNFKINTDDNFKPKAFTGGITYALINKRDHTLADFRNSEYRNDFQNFLNALQSSQTAYFNSSEFQNLTTQERAIHTAAIFRGMQYYNATGRLDSLPDIFKEYLSEAWFNTIHAKFDSLYEEIDKKALWTLSVNASTEDFKNVFDNLSVETIFLQGVAGDAFEADIRGNFNMKDTLSGEDDFRTDLSLKAGLNIHLINYKKHGKNTGKHLLEVKPQIEYSKIMQGLLPAEDEETLFANAEIRIHITDQLWIPVTVKYDTDNHNVFGFLNISWNLDVFKDFLYPEK